MSSLGCHLLCHHPIFEFQRGFLLRQGEELFKVHPLVWDRHRNLPGGTPASAIADRSYHSAALALRYTLSMGSTGGSSAVPRAAARCMAAPIAGSVWGAVWSAGARSAA